jgi:integrase
MPNPGKGELSKNRDGYSCRITLKGRERETYVLRTCPTEPEAEARKDLLVDLARRFRKAGTIDDPRARQLLKDLAGCPAAVVPAYVEVATDFTGGTPLEAAPSALTFHELRKQWTSGDLHKLYPDHVKAKDSDLDATRAVKLEAIDVGGTKLGDVPIDRFTLDHAERAMRNLPPDAKRPSTRRQYGQIISRVLALAVYPCRLIKASPLPRGFVPKVGRPPAHPYLYPDEEAKLCACQKPEVPLCYRLLWGFLAREGCRSGEAVGMRLGHELNLDRGVCSLDRNKTDDARAWALNAGVVRALKRYAELRGLQKGDRVFSDETGAMLENDKLAEKVRDHLLAAGVDRAELHTAGENRGKFRVHDLRGTFVTLSLANGHTETWVADRTGHTTSAMINRYRRAARSAMELRLGPLQPLDQAIPELVIAQPSPSDDPAAQDTGQAPGWQVQRITQKAEVAEQADAADSKSVAP